MTVQRALSVVNGMDAVSVTSETQCPQSPAFSSHSFPFTHVPLPLTDLQQFQQYPYHPHTIYHLH